MADDASAVQTYAIIPHSKWEAMDQRLKKAESETTSGVQDPPEEPPEEKIDNPLTVSEPPPLEEGREKKDVKLKYRKVQIKKLLSHIERQEGGQGITSLENIDEFIQSALGSSRKILPHEFKFFSFLFDNNLAHFVKNRWKIALYYNNRDNWFQV